MNRKCVTRVETFAIICVVCVCFWVQLYIHPIFVQLKIKTKATNRTLFVEKKRQLYVLCVSFQGNGREERQRALVWRMNDAIPSNPHDVSHVMSGTLNLQSLSISFLGGK